MRRAWFTKGNFLKVPVPSQWEENRNFTVYGAVSTALKKGYFIQFGDKTDRIGFKNFLQNLVREVKRKYSNAPPVTVLGKHRQQACSPAHL